MSALDSSDDDIEMAIELRASPSRRSAREGGSSSGYLKTVVRQQQEATKTCRLLALEVGSLKAELTRESKKRAQAINRATKAEAAYQCAEQRLLELQYSNSKLQQERTAAKEAAESSSRRVQSLKQSLAAAEAEAQERTTRGQQQVLLVATCCWLLTYLLLLC
jgi:chromosome segregation ATPase